MALIYKNPTSSIKLSVANSVERTATFGTNFSVLQVGGYMEVYELNDLELTLTGSSGVVGLSANTIPIRYSIRALPFLPDSVVLNSDNISSGRRRLGMLVYVHETKQTYQYTIDDYETLWDAAVTDGSVSEQENGTTVTNDTTAGTNLINAWTGSTIEGQNGVTRDNARWRIFWGTDWQITGGTYNSGTGTLSLDNNTGGTINVTGFTTGGGSDTYVTGGTITYNSQGTLQLSLNDDSNVDVTGFTALSNATLVGGTLTLIKNVGDDIVVTGFTTVESDVYITGGTFTETTGTLTLSRNDDNVVDITGWGYVKTVTESSNVFTVTLNDDSTTLLTVDAVTGLGRNVWALSGTSTGVSAPAVELPFITGGTYSSGTITLGVNNGLESNISITGLDSDDTYLTSATYSPTTLTLGMNDGSEFAIGGFAPEITGGTYSSGTLSLLNNTGGSVDITGITFTSTNIYNTDGQLEGNRVIDQDSNSLTFSGGSVSMGTNTTNPVCALLEMASTTQGLLIPRMTQVQRLAINTPLPGLLVYCTDTDSNGSEGMYMYKSVGWVNVL
jgi:hypothetical protein